MPLDAKANVFTFFQNGQLILLVHGPIDTFNDSIRHSRLVQKALGLLSAHTGRRRLNDDAAR